MVETTYQTTNEKIEEKTRKINFIVFRVSTPLLNLFNIVSSIFRYVSSGHSNESLQLIYPSWFLLNWKTPALYLPTYLIQCFIMQLTGIQFITTMILVTGFCLFLVDFTVDLQQNIREFSQIITQNGPLNIRQRFDLKQKLNSIIQFHAEAKEFCVTFLNYHAKNLHDSYTYYFLFV